MGATKKQVKKAVKKEARRSTRGIPSPKGTAGGKIAALGQGLAGAVGMRPAAARGRGRHRKVTATKLMNQILILKLKKKLMRLKYGGR